jgi:hypothetical protein
MGNFVKLVPLALGAAAVGRIICRQRGFRVRATPPMAPVVRGKVSDVFSGGCLCQQLTTTATVDQTSLPGPLPTHTSVHTPPLE